jgi:phage tail-like protein
MDANGTRFHLLLGQDDWAQCKDADTAIQLDDAWNGSPTSAEATNFGWDDAPKELTLQPRLFQFVAAPKDTPAQLGQRRGAGRDSYGNWYWVGDSKREVLVNSSGTGVTSHFWSADDTVEQPTVTGVQKGAFHPKESVAPPHPLQLAGLTVTEDHYLVVGVLEPAGLLIFDLHAGGGPQQVLWPAGEPFVPFDMAPMHGGGAFILDRVHKCYWALDRSLNIMTGPQVAAASVPGEISLFQPKDAGIAPLTVSPPSQAAGVALPLALNDPIAIEGLPDCSVLILDHVPGSPFSSIYRYVFAQQYGMVSTALMKDVIEQDRQATFRLHGYDIAFVPEHPPLDAIEVLDSTALVPDRLYVVSDDGNQAYAFNLSLEGEQLVMTLPSHLYYYPMRLFGGKGLVASATLAYYDYGDSWIPLVGQARSRYVEEATLLTPLNANGVAGKRSAFDGSLPDCTWHRLLFDASIPSGTQVQIWSRAANSEGDLEKLPWQAEPPLYQRNDGSELPFAQSSRVGNTGTWELLFQQAQGRYLQLKLKLSSNARSTPHIRAMRIYFPRFSYLDHYLPALYREDSHSASFLDRFLANVEGFNTAIEDKIVAVRSLFNICSTPAGALEWLANWFGVFLDPAWSEAKQRLFLKHAMGFFRWRGTMRGLQMALRLALEDCVDESIFTDAAQESMQELYSIRIVEAYRTRFAPGVVFGDPTDLEGLRPTPPLVRWVPQLGRARLVQDFDAAVQEHLVPSIRNTLLRQGITVKVATDYPISPPADSLDRGVWGQASRKVLGFVPAAQVDSATDTQIWQDFLQRRYRRVDALNTAHQVAVSDFTEMPLYAQLPLDGAALQDWYQFETIVLPMRKAAHRFTVLLPVDSTEEANSPQQLQRRELARRIIELEKPAHTSFEVKFYWAFFRIGEARLGLDTLMNSGSRAPQLFPPLTLGRDSLGESFLAPGHPYNVADRFVLGRDRLEQ